MRISIGSDHAGFSVKNKIEKYLESKKIEVIDVGPFNDNSVDYPDYAKKVCDEVINNKLDFGIAVCGSGIGISIACNKIKGIRAALIYDEETAMLSKLHNNANVICIGARKNSFEEITKMIDVYIETKFEIRHQKRVEKISDLEK